MNFPCCRSHLRVYAAVLITTDISHTLPIQPLLLMPIFCIQRSLRSQGFSLGGPCPHSNRVLLHPVLSLPESSVSLGLSWLPPCPWPHPTLNPVRTEACFHPSPPPDTHTHRTVHYFTHFKFPPIQGQLRKKKSS